MEWVGPDGPGPLTDSLRDPHCYIGPLFQFNTIVDREVRAELGRPTFLFVGLTTGVEF
jgi:hypothetical protein